MRCNSVKKLLPEYVEDSLSPKYMFLVSDHLSACDSCREAELACRQQLLELGRTFKAAAGSCPEYPVLSKKVLLALQQSSSGSRDRLTSLRLFLRPAFSFAMLSVITAVAALLFFQGIMHSTGACAPELTSGRQQAFTAQPREDGRVFSGIVARRFARIQTAESGWPR